MIKQVVNYLSNLININTTIDSNNETEGVLYIKKVFDEIGIENKVYEPVLNKGNLYAVIKGESQQSILLHSHIDTANYSEQNWLFPPDKATIFNNCAVGRGTLDCKGLTAIWMAIMRNIYLSDKKPKNTIIFLCTCDEESGGKYGTKWVINNTNILDNVKLVFGEGGGYPIQLGNNIYFTIQTGEIYMDSEEINNTNYTSNKIDEIFNKAIEMGYYNQNTLEFYNKRHLQTKRKIPDRYFYENVDILLNKSHTFNHEHIFNLIQKELSGYKLLPVITPGYSDNRLFREKGIPTLGFFPLDIKNNISGIHGANEYISFKSLKLSYEILTKTISHIL